MLSVGRWKIFALFFGIFCIGGILFVVMRPASSTQNNLEQLQIENRTLKRYVQEQQQDMKLLNEQLLDLETLNKVQQQVIEELRQGNELLQQQLYTMEKDILRYKEAYKSK